MEGAWLRPWRECHPGEAARTAQAASPRRATLSAQTGWRATASLPRWCREGPCSTALITTGSQHWAEKEAAVVGTCVPLRQTRLNHSWRGSYSTGFGAEGTCRGHRECATLEANGTWIVHRRTFPKRYEPDTLMSLELVWAGVRRPTRRVFELI
jgi:hypothetical protein